MPTAWRRFALFGVAFVLLALGNVARAVLGSNRGALPFALTVLQAVLFTAMAVLFLRQAVLRRRAGRSSRG